MPSEQLEREMWKAGYVPASVAAQLAMVSATGTIYRNVEAGRLVGIHSGSSWFITIASLLAFYGENPVIVKRIKEWRPCAIKLPAKTKRAQA